MKPLVLILILCATILNAAGQLLLKRAMMPIGPIHTIKRLLSMDVLFSPFTILGFACYGVASIMWLVVLSRLSLSYAYPMVALGYVIIVFASAAFLGEDVSPMRWLAVLIICLGVGLLART